MLPRQPHNKVRARVLQHVMHGTWSSLLLVPCLMLICLLLILSGMRLQFGCAILESASRRSTPSGPPGGSPVGQANVKTLNRFCPQCEGPLCKRKFLFIVATGRSGSTSLMNMVSLIDGVFLYGENYGALRHLGQMQERFFSTLAAQGHDAPLLAERLLLHSQDWLWDFLTPPSFLNDWKQSVSIRGFKDRFYCAGGGEGGGVGMGEGKLNAGVSS